MQWAGKSTINHYIDHSNNSMIKIALVFLFLIFCNYDSHSVPRQNSDTLESHIDRILAKYIGNNRPGATIGIIHNGRLVFKKGYGMANLERSISNSPATIYKIASVSKQFTAAAIIQLVRKNRLSLTDDIHKYIPDFPDYGKPITISNLLYHTSGIRDYMVLMWLSGKSFEDNFSNQDALDIIMRQSSLHFTTGHRCVYSNSNYILLAEIIKRTTGTSLTQYAHKNLFDQLGMSHSGFGNAKQATPGYRKNDVGYTPYKNANKTMGDGGMFTTLSDLAKWDETFYETASISHQLLTRGRLDNGNILTYGMGIMTGYYRGEPVQMHPGAFLGYRAEMLRFPEKHITIICLGNSEDINPETITRSIADVYIFNDKISEAPAEIQFNSTILGKYEVAPNVFIDIKHENNQLTGQVSGQPKHILYADSANTYKIGTTGDKVKFNEHLQELTVLQKQGSTNARKPESVQADQLHEYAGIYHSEEQKATYSFYAKEGTLWFTVGTNPAVKAEILKKYDRVYFSYQNLESATIEFIRNSTGQVKGFTLSSGRVSGLKFIKIDPMPPPDQTHTPGS